MFTKRKFYRSPDPDESGGGAAAESEKQTPEQEAAEIAALEKEAADKEKEPTEPQAMTEEKGFKIEDLEKQEPAKEKTPEELEKEKESGKEKEEKKKVPSSEKKETDDDEQEGELTFKIKDEDATSTQEEESNWITVGKEFGLEIKEDSFEEFQKAVSQRIVDAPVAKEEEVFDKKIASLDPEAKQLFQFLSNKGKLSDYINPVKQYDDILALSNEDLVRKSLKLNKWEDDKIDEKVQLLKEEGKLDNEAYGLRKSVEKGKEDTVSRLFTTQQQKAEAEKTSLRDKTIKEDKDILSALNKVEKFMGGVLPKSERDKLYKNWENGKYRQAFANDPDFVVNAILSYELKEQMLESVGKKKYEEGLNKNQDKLHNLKQVNSKETGSKRPRQLEEKEGPNFANWKVDLEN